MKDTIKVGFFVAGYKGFETLKSFMNTHDAVVDFVCTYPVKGTCDESYETIRALARDKNIAVYDFAKEWNVRFDTVDILFCVGWQFLFSVVTDKMVVLHDSYLPQYRGFCPTVEALMHGDDKLGASAFLPGEKVDEGPIISQKKQRITYPLSIRDAYDIVVSLYLDLIDDVLSMRRQGEYSLTEQSTESVSYCVWRDELDYYVDWTMRSDWIMRFIHAVGWPYGGARTLMGKETITLLDAQVVDDVPIVNRTPGKIWQLENGDAIVMCGEGLLKITKAVNENDNTICFNTLRQRLTMPLELLAQIANRK